MTLRTTPTGLRTSAVHLGRRFDTKEEAEAFALRVGKEWINQNMCNRDTRRELEERMDELARRFAETHEQAVRAEILELARCISEMKTIH